MLPVKKGYYPEFVISFNLAEEDLDVVVVLLFYVHGQLT